MSIRICSRKEESLGFRSNYKMASRNFLVATLLTIIVCAATTPATADSIHGCGGFVEASRDLIKSRKPTDAKLDYSHITVELRTLDGLVKDRTQCAPNGYYFIPVYDKGSFLIKVKGPEGWSWDPDQVRAVVDHSGCNGNEDINFRFTGFTVSGRVVGAVGGESCPLKSGGPSNVNIELVSLSGDLVSSVLTSSAGVYLFANILPGKYTIRASRHDLVIQVKGSSEVEVGFGNVLVDDILFVPGYDIRGSVVAQGNPILGVHMYLYSDDVLEVDCPQGSGIAPGERKPLCHALSDADGMFTFKSIPCGVYELVPYYKGENTIFDVSPPSTSVLVQHDHATVLQPFQVTGFSLGGRVVDGSGMGVDGVKIIVDGNHRFVTDRGGYYKLDQVTSKRYTIEAEKEHYKFESLKDFLVLPNMASIDDIKAISYDVCGVVRMVSSDYIAKVALTHGPENVKPQVKHIDENGNFCFEVPSGEYRLSSFAATSESAPELLFLPPYVDVMVNSPILNIEFYQAQVNIHGSVACKEECDSSVSIDLIRLDGKSKDARNTVSLVDKSSEFLFPNVLPGKYRLEVKHNLPGAVSGKDKWCWEQNFVNVNVGTEDVKDIVFVQKGYWVDLISTHDVDAYLTQPHGQHLDLKIKKGSQRTCVESPGPHELHFVNSCIFFGSLSMEIDTSSPLPVYLKAEKYLIKGQIYVEASSVNAIAKLPEDILVELLNDEGAVAAGTNARLVANGNDQTSDALYEYSVWANPGEKLTFVPWDVRENGEEKILFYPKLLHFPVIQDGCQTTVPTFTGRLGLYIKGSVSPPLSDVNIRVIAAEDSLNAALKKGELALETNTGVDGLFVGGPLYDDTTYITEASKPGYHVKAVGPHSFSCQKLGQISVRIYSKEDGNELFASVLLSLSGEDGYRNNSVTGAAGFLFDNLFPGSFYLRPLLKEYAFSPPAQAIELASGESREVIFQATRVAYSAMGLVTLLSGQPKEGVPVEARAESEGYYEETVTDSSGTYRLRGLQPGTTYVVKVTRKGALDNDRIERASPESFVIKVGSEDIRGLDFLVFEQPEITLLSGHVKGERLKELHAHLYVEIRSASDPSRILSAFPLPLSNFFQVKDLPKSKHLLQLRSSLPSSTLRFESEVIEVDLEKNTQVHVGPIGYKVEDDHHKQELTPAPVYPLIAGVLVIALLFSMPRLKDLYPVIMAAATSGSTSTVKKEAKKLVVRKKTY